MKSIHTLAICATIFFIGFSCSKAIPEEYSPSANTSDMGLAVQKWEYNFGVEWDRDDFNAAGKEGWEFVVLDSVGRAIFKRPLQ